jgi:hypothetical protein
MLPALVLAALVLAASRGGTIRQMRGGRPVTRSWNPGCPQKKDFAFRYFPFGGHIASSLYIAEPCLPRCITALEYAGIGF